MIIQECMERQRLKAEISYYRKDQAASYKLIGESTSMRELRDRLELISNSSAHNVLFTGETGTGKASQRGTCTHYGAGKTLRLSKSIAAPFPTTL